MVLLGILVVAVALGALGTTTVLVIAAASRKLRERNNPEGK